MSTVRELQRELDELRRFVQRRVARTAKYSGGGGGVQLSHGVIIGPCNAGCSTYRVQRVHRRLLSECDDCGSGSGSGSGS